MNLIKIFEQKYSIKNSSGYAFKDKLSEGTFNQKSIKNVYYRPFDSRFIYYESGFTSRPGFQQMKHMLDGDNIGVGFSRYYYGSQNYDFILATNTIIDGGLFSSWTYFTPLYCYLSVKKER